jgi:hypothetical protein
VPRRPDRSERRRRFRRRQAMALLLVAVLAAGIGGVLSASTDTESPAIDRAGRAREEAKRAARIEQLRRQLAQARKVRQAERAARSDQATTTASSPTSFSSFARRLPGEVGLAYAPVGRGGQVVSLGGLKTGAAWSTIKVALAARVIKDAGGPGDLSSRQRSLISAALTASDNAAAMSLWDELVSRYGGPSGAADAVTQILRAAGDTSTSVSSVGRASFSPYGQTDWSLSGQARFMAAVAGSCVPGSSYLRDQMGQVVSDQRWGLGTVGSTAFKGGWGPGVNGGYLVRQMGTIPTKTGTAVVTIAARPSNGSFATGQEVLDELASWAAQNIRAPTATDC